MQLIKVITPPNNNNISNNNGKHDSNVKHECNGDPMYCTDTTPFPISGLSILNHGIDAQEEERLVEWLDGEDESGRRRWKSTGFACASKMREQCYVRHEVPKDNNDGNNDKSNGNDKKHINENEEFDQHWGWLVSKFPHIYQANSRIEIQCLEYRGSSSTGAANLLEPVHPHWCSSVLEVSLCHHALLSMKLPIRPSNDCWDLVQPGGATKVLLLRRSVLIKNGVCLQRWRSHVSGKGQHPHQGGIDLSKICLSDSGGVLEPKVLIRDANYRRIGVKLRFFRVGYEKYLLRSNNPTNYTPPFSSLPAPPPTQPISTSSSTTSTQSQTLPTKFPPLEELLTIIITTSPIQSHPSTELLRKTFDTFWMAGYDFAVSCRKIIVCDGVRRLQHDDNEDNDNQDNDKDKDKDKDNEDDSPPKTPAQEQSNSKKHQKQPQQPPQNSQRAVSRKHSNAKQAMRNGIVNSTQATNYQAFKQALRTLCEEAEVAYYENHGYRHLQKKVYGESQRQDDGEMTPTPKPMPPSSPLPPLAPFANTQILELSTRHGYGFALREALQDVHTPYVCVIQHDRTFMRWTPVEEVVHAMMTTPKKQESGTNSGGLGEGEERENGVCAKQDSASGSLSCRQQTPAPSSLQRRILPQDERAIKYVGMSMRSNLFYYDQFLGKYGRQAAQTLKSMILYPTPLRLDSNWYGPSSQGTDDVEEEENGPENGCGDGGKNYGVEYMIESMRSEVLRDNLRALQKSYKGSESYQVHQEWVKSQQQQQASQNTSNQSNNHESHTDVSSLTQLSLIPTVFWYDNTHIVQTSHYRDFIFHPKYRMVKRGGFVEDKLSPVIVKQVQRLGLEKAHENFGCFLLQDHSGLFFTGHLDGGSYKTEEERRELSGVGCKDVVEEASEEGEGVSKT